MREIIEMADGSLMGINFDDSNSYDPGVETYYDWLNAIAYSGEGEYDPITFDEFYAVSDGRLTVVLEG